SSGPPHLLHSFPTRRSSDLIRKPTLTFVSSIRAPSRTWPVDSSLRTHCTTALALNLSGILRETTVPGATRSWGTTRPIPRRLKRSEEHTSELQSRFDLVCRL